MALDLSGVLRPACFYRHPFQSSLHFCPPPTPTHPLGWNTKETTHGPPFRNGVTDRSTLGPCHSRPTGQLIVIVFLVVVFPSFFLYRIVLVRRRWSIEPLNRMSAISSWLASHSQSQAVGERLIGGNSVQLGKAGNISSGCRMKFPDNSIESSVKSGLDDSRLVNVLHTYRFRSRRSERKTEWKCSNDRCKVVRLQLGKVSKTPSSSHI